MKTYDQAYFDRWYRHADEVRGGPQRLARKVAMAVAIAEHHLEHPLRRVLDIGCGEGAWRAPLLRLRPGLEYLGFDSSSYAVERFGARRNLRQARFGDFAQLRPGPPVDLLVCSDVIHYLPAAELRRGLSGFAELCDGVVYMDAFCRGDAFIGDTEGFHARPASWYRQLFEASGLSACGSHCHLTPALAARAAALELA